MLKIGPQSLNSTLYDDELGYDSDRARSIDEQIYAYVDDSLFKHSYDMFIAEIVAVNVDEKYMDETGKFDIEKCKLIAYSHGSYFSLGEKKRKVWIFS